MLELAVIMFIGDLGMIWNLLLLKIHEMLPSQWGS